MIEDKLSKEERIRLEALNQAVHATPGVHRGESIVDRAVFFEKYIREGNDKEYDRLVAEEAREEEAA